jgi:hypothetical protein
MKLASKLLAAGILLLNACGGGSEGATTTALEVPLQTTTSSEATTTTVAPEAETATLADYLPMMGPEDPAEAQEYWRQQEAAAQELTRDCMAEEGFEYIPYVPTLEDTFYDWEMDEEERIAQQGFGMAYWLLEERNFEDEWDPDDDPNHAIVEAMTESQREAYEYALHGEQPDMDLDWEGAHSEEEMRALEEEAERLYREREWVGCMELGWSEASGGQDAWMSFEEEFGDTWQELWERVEADPRIVAMEDDWSTCMADAGYEFRDMEDMWTSLDREFSTIVSWPGDEAEDSAPGITSAPAVPEVEPVENEDGTVTFVDPEGNEYTQEEMEAFWAPTFDETEVRAFMDKEIAIATADYACNKGRWERYEEVRKEYEAEWVANNKAALDAWKSSREAEG